MKSVPLSEAKDKLSALVEEASSTHEIIQITRHGHPTAVLIASEDFDALHETLHLLSQPGALAELRQAETDVASGNVTEVGDLRSWYGVVPR